MGIIQKAFCLWRGRLRSDTATIALRRAVEGRTNAMKMFMLALALAAVGLLGGASAGLADTNCTGTLGGKATVTTFNGNVTVQKNASCTLDFVNVTGNIQVSQGASLVVSAYDEPSTIGGNIEADHCNSVLLEGNVMVKGNLEIHQCIGPAGFQGPGIKIGGNFECHNNSGPCEAWLGNVDGNVQIHNNGSKTASDISLVTIGGNLECEQNTPAPTHNAGPDWVTGKLQDQCGANLGFAAKGTSIVAPGTPSSAGMACANLKSLTNFPVPNTMIISATDTPATATLPERCIVNGIVNAHVSPVDACNYGDSFQVAMPVAGGSSFGTTTYPGWNGRFVFQGGGGSEGSVPAATGRDGTSSGGSLSPAIAHGYAVATQDGGHENSQLAVCGTKSNNGFYLDPMGVIDNSYQSIQVTALNAKYLIDAYYGRGPNYSYWEGCSTGGRQGMVMSQNFPQYFDGIVAGDPVYDLEMIGLSELYGVQFIYNSYAVYPGGTVPRNAANQPLDSAAFPASDQALFETALLQACDGLDGFVDGVIDNLPACLATFNPATATYVSGGTTLPLQCTGAKNATCLLPTQIQAAMAINQGPRTATGRGVAAPAGAVAEDHAPNIADGYAYDGGWMAPAGIPSRKIGTPTSTPGDYSLGVGQFDFLTLFPPNLTFDPLTFNFTTDLDMLNPSTPEVTASTSLDISKFIQYGHKIIWFHGLSDPGPPVLQTINYYNDMAEQHGGLEAAQNFSRFYPIPNMGHCGGGPATDTFDMLTPLTQWVENGVAPGPVVATGTNFAATNSGYGTGLSSYAGLSGPTTRSRPLCPYPQEARYIGSTAAGLGVASNYECINPASDHDHGKDHDSDDGKDHDDD
jgi:Tannase and feruloyl esterase